MAEIVGNCPRCNSKKITFILRDLIFTYQDFGWKNYYEAFCICKNCLKSTIFEISNTSNDSSNTKISEIREIKIGLNNYYEINGYISTKNFNSLIPPNHLPEDIKKAYEEATFCFSISCYNASAAMFRLCIDIATKGLLPDENVQGLNNNIKRSLGLRLEWLFNNNLLHAELKDISNCIREDGNDGVHVGNLKKEDAEDLLDFTEELLRKLYTETARLELAKQRRIERRNTE